MALPYARLTMTNTPIESLSLLTATTGSVGEPATAMGKVAARRSAHGAHRDAVRAAKARLRRERTVAALVAALRTWRWRSAEDKASAACATVLTRDFVRATLEARAAEGDQFALMALAAHR